MQGGARRFRKPRRDTSHVRAMSRFPKVTATIFGSGVIAGLCLSALFGSKNANIEAEEFYDEEPGPHGVDVVYPVPVVPENLPQVNEYGPVRDAPKTFARNSYLPNIREGEASGSITAHKFSPGRDLVYVDDARVWWKSDHRAASSVEDDCCHSMHKSMVDPFKRLANLVSETGWILKVQESYSGSSVHASKSLHKQGRAIDITVGRPAKPSERLNGKELQTAYEELAKLAWRAGFDWVYYEYGSGTGPHIHASVKAERN